MTNYPDDGGLGPQRKELFFDVMKPYEDMIRESLGLDETWTYRSLPWMLEEFYNKFLDIVGEENTKFASGSQRNYKLELDTDGKPYSTPIDGVMVRVSLFINERGMANLAAYNTTQRQDK